MPLQGFAFLHAKTPDKCGRSHRLPQDKVQRILVSKMKRTWEGSCLKNSWSHSITPHWPNRQ
jgi:hypothetical protein